MNRHTLEEGIFLKKLLQTLTQIGGSSGYVDEVRLIMRRKLHFRPCLLPLFAIGNGGLFRYTKRRQASDGTVAPAD